MGIWTMLLTGIGLSMDAFAVSVCKGLGMRKMQYVQALVIGLFFGGFQALMPMLGYFLGTQFADYIREFDHWLAFVLLAFIGGKMVVEACKKGKAEEEKEQQLAQEPFRLQELFLLAIATSIDALAVGVTFAFLEVNIWLAIAVIGSITFLISIIGVWIGHQFGNRFEKKAELLGGIILVAIGIKILVEHLLETA